MSRWTPALALALLGLPAGCSGGDGEVRIPGLNVDPCARRETYWPVTVSSDRFPLQVHHWAGQEDAAEEALGYLETAWDVEVGELGFSPPVPDDGACGPDGDFDVFLWPGTEESYVASFDEVPDTPWDDRLAYMVVDAEGPYGGDLFDATLAHEFNHACQAADDWWESVPIFEMTSTFMEEVVFDDDDTWKDILGDFQDNPDWSLDRDDGYETWYMYSAQLYLQFLRERYYDGDASFAAEMWRTSRNPPGAEDDPALNEPDFEDALDTILQRDASVTFFESVAEFERWRWFTGDQDDGAHFEEGASIDGVAFTSAEVGTDASVSASPMLLGATYLSVSHPGHDDFEVSLESDDSAVEWVVQAVPGLGAGSDGETLDLASGPVRVDLTAQDARVLIVTALPAGAYDPDTRTDARHAYTLHLAP